jgi:hypothetical protein
VHFDIYIFSLRESGWRKLNAVERVRQNGEGGTQEDIPSHSTREGSWPARRKLQPRLGRSPEVWLVMEDLYDSVLLLRYTLPAVQG